MGGKNALHASEWHFDDFRTDKEEHRKVRFALVDDLEDLPVVASAVANPARAARRRGEGCVRQYHEEHRRVQYADPQKIAQATSKILAKTRKHDIEQTASAWNLVPKAGTDDVEGLGVRGKKVFANLTS